MVPSGFSCGFPKRSSGPQGPQVPPSTDADLRRTQGFEADLRCCDAKAMGPEMVKNFMANRDDITSMGTVINIGIYHDILGIKFLTIYNRDISWDIIGIYWEV